MEKRRLLALSGICLLVIMAFSLSASAEHKESVHKAWHKHNDNFTINDVDFEVKAGGEFTKVLISVGNEAVIVQNGTCIDKFNMSLCLHDVKYPPLDLHKEYNPYDYEYYIEVWFYLADISISRQIDKTELLIGEKAKVEVEIQNNGSLAAEDIKFRDSYPDFFVSSVVGCSFDKHNVTWQGILRKNQRKTCSYYIEAVKSTTFSSSAKASYLAGVGTRTDTAESSRIKLTVPELEISMKESISAASVNAGDNVTFNVTLENTRDDYSFSTVALAVFLPEGIDVVGYSGGISPVGKALRWSGKIDKSESRNFSATFRVRHSGEQRIRTNLNYNVGSIVRIVDKTDNVTGIIDELSLQYISFISNAESGGSGMLYVNINNPSSRYEFRDVKVKITTNLPESFGEYFFDEIGQKRFWNILARNISFPVVGDITHYKVNFDVEYKTEYSQAIKLNETRTVTVSPRGAAKAAQAISPTRQRIQEEIEKIGAGRFTLGFVVFVLLFFLSSLHYIKKVVGKVHEYEQYEK